MLDSYVIIGSSDDITDYLNAAHITDLSTYSDGAIFKMFAVTGVKPMKSGIETTKKVNGTIKTNRFRDDLFKIVYQPFYVNNADNPNTYEDLAYLRDVIFARNYIWIEISNRHRLADSTSETESDYWGYGALQRYRVMVELLEESGGENFEKGIDELTQTWQVVTQVVPTVG